MPRAVPLRSCESPRSAAAASPWHRRVATGLEGQLVLCFMVLLTAALGASLWMFVTESTDTLDAMAKEQAAQVSRMAMASRLPLERRDSGEGYVTVSLAHNGNESRVRNIALSVLLIGVVAAGVSFPLMYWLVHRVFQPIRQLVAATDRIAMGELETRVALNRSDVIGTLARSFNEMVKRVRSQQQDLACANRELAEANANLAAANTKLSNSNRDLEEKVHQRTAQAEAAAKQLEAANRRLSSEIAEKEDFLRTVSHDLNAPLRNIAGMAATLLMKYRGTFDEEVVRRLERICKNVEVETDLIAELLELSRIKTRRQKMEIIDVNELLGELAELFDQDLETGRIRLTVDGPLPLLECERPRIRQVFQNLIDNAIKYMGETDDARAPAKAREITVGFAAHDGEAEFHVRDTGVGIAAEDLEKVFHVFRRGSGEAVRNIAGKGVGLASVKSIVETYSGTIWAESQLGIGSTFRFTINGKYVHDPSAGTTSAAFGRDAQYKCPAA